MLIKFLKKIFTDSFKGLGLFIVMALTVVLMSAVVMTGCIAVGYCFQWVPFFNFLYKEGVTRIPGYMVSGIFLSYLGTVLWSGGEYMIKTWKEMSLKK